VYLSVHGEGMSTKMIAGFISKQRCRKDGALIAGLNEDKWLFAEQGSHISLDYSNQK
jgi:hypothetical protein